MSAANDTVIVRTAMPSATEAGPAVLPSGISAAANVIPPVSSPVIRSSPKMCP